MKSDQKNSTKVRYSVERLKIDKLKNIRDFEFDLRGSPITGILGVNGIGKSTILHALACVYRPHDAASVEYNRLSDFFKTNPHANWQGSKFEVDIRSVEIHSNKPPSVDVKTVRYYKDSQKWSPKYVNRPRNESLFIGLEGIQTAGEDPTGYRFRNYKTIEDANEAEDLIRRDLTYILGREYSKINTHVVSKGNNQYVIEGLEWNSVTYSELSMGSGEKRVLKILKAIHHPKFDQGGIVLVDELDILLHDLSFRRLLEILIRKAESKQYKIKPLQIVFSTHRESVAKFADRINICSLFQTPSKTFSFPYVTPDVMLGLTGRCEKPLEIYVEDDLAEDIVSDLVFRKNMIEFVQIARFGAWQNAFTIIASKLLQGLDVNNVICVLDGDECNSDLDRMKRFTSALNGDDKIEQREFAMKAIKNFQLLIDNSPEIRVKALPEYNHKRMFDSILFDPTDKMYRVQCCSKDIVGLDDWHDYYPELARRTNIKKVRELVLHALASSQFWQNYVRQIDDWLELKKNELGLTPRSFEPLKSTSIDVDKNDLH